MSINSQNSSFFDDLTDEEFDRVSAMDANEIKALKIQQQSHIANGGEATFPCPACNGTGRWGYAGRPCFKCKTTGKVSKGQNAAHKATLTRAANMVQYREDHADLIEGMQRHLWNRFVKSMYDQIMLDERKLTENQEIAVTDAINRYDAQNQARLEAKQAARIEKSGTVNLAHIHELFTKATSSGLKRPIFRSTNLTVKMARRHLNVLYVTSNTDGYDTYLGKITDGNFLASNQATETTLSELRMICDDPTKALFNYSRSTATYDANGNMISCGCGICGKELTDPISMQRGIGPICANNFGL